MFSNIPNLMNFYIKNNNLSEEKKLNLRQELIKPFFDVTFPIETVSQKNCENLVGSVEVPVGVVGPVTANVSKKNFEKRKLVKSKLKKRNFAEYKQVSKEQKFLIPLATTEGALVASINRGCKVLNLSQTNVLVEKIGMSRSLIFECSSIVTAQNFIDFFEDNLIDFIKECESTSNHLKYISHQIWTRGKLVYIRFVFDTDQAMGMNMVTIALKHAWDIFGQTINQVKLISISGNVCVDKKESVVNRIFGRGIKVALETFLSEKIVNEELHTTSENIVKTHVSKNLIGTNLAGSFSQNMHVTNAFAAFYIATGQDPAQAIAGSEASVHFELAGEGSKGLYASLNIPNINVATVGGGTWLPKQKQAQSIILLGKKVKTEDLAVAVSLASFAGEISGIAALANGSLAKAHATLGR
jgi:hydroxymethylglutaryl-CoA reductase (NADPH)